MLKSAYLHMPFHKVTEKSNFYKVWFITEFMKYDDSIRNDFENVITMVSFRFDISLWYLGLKHVIRQPHLQSVPSSQNQVWMVSFFFKFKFIQIEVLLERTSSIRRPILSIAPFKHCLLALRQKISDVHTCLTGRNACEIYNNMLIIPQSLHILKEGNFLGHLFAKIYETPI